MTHIRLFRFLSLLAVTVPLAAVIVAIVSVWGWGVGWAELSACAVMFVLTMIGVEVGYHRHFAHRSFQAAPALRHALAALGSMAFQGTVVWWCGLHRTHHQFSDRPGDPHSPLEGFFLAHFGWLFRNASPQRWTRRVKDLLRDPVASRAHRMYYVWLLLGLAIPAVSVALLRGSWWGLASGLLWGGLVRIFLVNHTMWSINSICHCFGSQPYELRDRSRNNAWLLIPSLGAALHNNHHAFPQSAVNAHRRWELDLGGLLILLLERVGWVWDVRVPGEVDVARKSETAHTGETPVTGYGG